MSWTRRWGVIGCITLAQIGVIVGYQALVSAGPAPASADETVTPPIAAQTAPPPQSSAGNVPAPQAPVPGGGAEVPQYLPLLTGTGSTPNSGEAPVVMSLQGAGSPSGAAPLTPPSSSAALPPLPDPKPDPNPLPTLIPVTAKDGPGCAPLPPAGAPCLPQSPSSVQQPKVAPEPVAVCPWNLSVEIVDGRTHLTAKTGSDVQFKIICEKLELQTPRGSITASGKVMIASDSVEGVCDRLTISWHDEAVVLDKVQMKCKLEGNEAELQADQLRLRLSRFVEVVQPCPYQFQP
jgi:hypothetical protein